MHFDPCGAPGYTAYASANDARRCMLRPLKSPLRRLFAAICAPVLASETARPFEPVVAVGLDFAHHRRAGHARRLCDFPDFVPHAQPVFDYNTLRKGEMPSFLLHLISCSVDGLRRKHKRSYCSKWQNRKSLRFWQGESCRRRRRGAPSLPRTPTPRRPKLIRPGSP